MLPAPPNPDLSIDVGKIIGGAVLVAGAAWGVIRKWSANRRVDGVADAQAAVQVDSFQAYSQTITMLNTMVKQLRDEPDSASARRRGDMDAPDARLKQASDQVDSAIRRARQAEDLVDKLRAQLRAANMEPAA
jgi:hypothetical protein